MKRRLFNLAAVASLVALMAVLSLWIRGAVGPVKYERRDWDESGMRHALFSIYGGVVAVGTEGQRMNAPLSSSKLAEIRGLQIRIDQLRPPSTAPVNNFMLYSFASGTKRLATSQYSGWGLRFRLWPVAVLTAVMPGIWVTSRIRQAQRAQIGLCPICGYDLRATPDRCPECGTSAEMRKSEC